MIKRRIYIICDSIQIQEVKKKKQNKTKRKEKKKIYLPINIDNKSEILSLSWYKLVQLLHLTVARRDAILTLRFTTASHQNAQKWLLTDFFLPVVDM